MEREYFNYSTHFAGEQPGYWARRDFVQRWRKIYAGDKRWTPPAHVKLMAALTPGRWPHLTRQRPLPIYLSALQRRRPTNRRTDSSLPLAGSMTLDSSMMEQPVCAAVLLADPRNRERTGSLALIQCVNDEEVLERFVWTLMEQSYMLGVRRFVGPSGFSPSLSAGVLKSHFADAPPLYTPYNPPYVAEIFGTIFEEIGETRLLHAAVPPVASPTKRDAWRCEHVPIQGITDPIRRLILSSHVESPYFAAPDDDELDFVLDWLGAWPMELWVAYHRAEPVGYVILQPDLGDALRRAGGGRTPAWRAWLRWRGRRPTKDGRIVLGGVRADQRRQGIGRFLWQHTLDRARINNWQTLTVGPVPNDSAAIKFLCEMNAIPRQAYALFAYDL